MGPKPPTLKFPMEYQQSSTPAMTFNQPPALQYHLPATTAPISMEYHQSAIPAIEMNQCHECDDTTSSQKALIPPSHPHLRREFGQMESLILSQPRVRSLPTPVLGGVHDMVLRPGYMYCPVHTEVYGTYRARDARTEGTTL